MTISNSGGRSPELSETTGVRRDLNVPVQTGKKSEFGK